MARKTNKTQTVVAVVETQVAANVAEVLAEATTQLTENVKVVTETVVQLTKADLGRTIFNEELNKEGGLVRKTTIDRLIAEAGLTKAGAATYYQNMKKKAGLVHSKVEQVQA